MIIVEERLTNVFSQLPEIDGLKPQYESGNDDHLNKFLIAMAKDSKSAYPLIYQVSNSDDQDSRANHTIVNLVLILATRNTQTELLNSNRYAMSYRNVLNPLLENIEKAFYRAGIFDWDGKYKIEKFMNYGDGKANKTVDIWDAIRFSTTITINGNCINNNIKF